MIRHSAGIFLTYGLMSSSSRRMTLKTGCKTLSLIGAMSHCRMFFPHGKTVKQKSLLRRSTTGSLWTSLGTNARPGSWSSDVYLLNLRYHMSHHNSLTGLLDLWVLLAHPPNQLSLGLNEPTVSSKPGMIAYVMSIIDTIEPKPLPVWKEVRAKLEVVVAHLFSGRRRIADFHEHLNQWAEEHYCNIVVLSLDTAVSSHYGNLHNESVSWLHFLTLLRSGAITGALTGSPCETYSAARTILHPLIGREPGGLGLCAPTTGCSAWKSSPIGRCGSCIREPSSSCRWSKFWCG